MNQLQSYKSKSFHIAILTCSQMEGYKSYDRLLQDEMLKKNWSTTEVIWDDPSINWSDFDLALIRSTWDYTEKSKEFLQVMQKIEKSSCLLLNPFEIVQWNANKEYLKDLENWGIPIVPARFDMKNFPRQEEWKKLFDLWDCDELVIKPKVSACAEGILRLKKNFTQSDWKKVEDNYFAIDRDFLVNPFLKQILNFGEVSHHFFNGEFSHAILKKPKEGDFRSQEEFGSHLCVYKAQEKAKLSGAFIYHEILKSGKTPPLFMRIDMIPQNHLALEETLWQVIEAEMVEPSLYFQMDQKSPGRFISALLDYLKRFFPSSLPE